VSVTRRFAAALAAAALLFAGGARASDDGAALRAELAGAIAKRAPWMRVGETAEAAQAFDALPLRFEPNRGQADPSARFIGRAGATLVFVRDRDLTLALPGEPSRLVRLRWLGGADAPSIAGEGEQPSRSHYFGGRDADTWVRDVPGYDRVRASAVYPGVDLVAYGRDGALEFDLAVAPGADPDAIRFAVDGADRVALDGDALVIGVGDGTLRLHAPVAYQEIDGERRAVAARWKRDGGELRFALGAFDRRAALVIDPVLGYSGYLGGTGTDLIHAVAVDRDGQLVVVGRTTSADFPLANALYTTKSSATMAFVAKIKAGGNQLLWSTFLGGARALSGYDQMGVSLDAQGDVVVTGETSDPNFPVVNAWQPSLAGGNDAFVTKLTPSGNGIVFSTYLGGSGEDYGRGVAFDAEGYIAVVGITFSSDFPLKYAMQTSLGGGSDAFVTRLFPDGVPIFSTYLGGSSLEWGYEVAQSTLGEAVVVGFTQSPDFPTTPGAYQPDFGGGADVFVTRFVADGTSRVYSTFVGGSDYEEALGVALDLEGDAYVVGWTRSPDFPTISAFQSAPQGGDYDGYAFRLSADGSTLRYSTRLGGSGTDFAYAVSVDLDHFATIAGTTSSTDFPTLQPVQAANAGSDDGFVVQLAPTGNGLRFGTYLGGNLQENPFGAGFGVATDASGDIYVGQSTASTSYPLSTTVLPFQTTNRGGLDGAVTKITMGPDVLLRLRATASGTSGRFRIANGTASNRPVELRFWVESPANSGPVGVLTLTDPITLPANFAPVDLSFTLPLGVPFPPSKLGFRLLDPVTGEVLAESVCATVPCN